MRMWSVLLVVSAGACQYTPAPLCRSDECVTGCHRDPDCPLGQICVQDRCLAGCRSPRDCASGWTCDAHGAAFGVCVVVPPVDAAPDAVPDAVVDAPPPPDAYPPDAAYADAPSWDGCAPIALQLLTNPSFDQGPTGWTATDSRTITNLATTVTPKSPPYVVWLGGDFNVDQVVSQTVAVPADATALTLKGWMIVATDEASTTVVYDRLEVQLYQGATKLAVLATRSNLDGQASATWLPFEVPIQPTRAGQAITLRFEAWTDASFNTNFFVDSLELDATVCR